MRQNSLEIRSLKTCARTQETPEQKSTLTGKDVGVSVLLLVVVLVGRLVRPVGIAPRQELQKQGNNRAEKAARPPPSSYQLQSISDEAKN